MSKARIRNKIFKSDYNRVLVTETLPFETPIIFSNDGLYDWLSTIDAAGELERRIIEELVFHKRSAKKLHSTIPYNYKIRKSTNGFRKLSLVHPASQWKVREFYKEYESLILHHCKYSPASIRTPFKISSSYYFKSSAENLKQYKDGTISLLKNDNMTKHSPSFYAYREYDRLYKFFESQNYYELEKKYACMKTLDVAKCFDSIYTHTMSWAIKSKEFTKKNISNSATFAQKFDALMRHMNYGETSGIVIGPEISRIFAEVIFQEIDVLTILRLSKKQDLEYGQHYIFKRYVDDVFIFAQDSKKAQIIYDCYSDSLIKVNLHTNPSKSVELSRPFITKKSRIIKEASNAVNLFIDKFLTSLDSRDTLDPLTIHSPWKLSRSFLEELKVICSKNEVDYDEVSGYLIAIFNERIKKLVSREILDEKDGKNLKIKYRDALLVLLEIMFFLYQVSPSVGASYKLSTSIILSVRFSNKHIPEHKNTIKQKIYELTVKLLERAYDLHHVIESYVSLEELNIALASRELGDDYLLPEHVLRKVFFGNDERSYFSIISCLFYTREQSQYSELHKKALKSATFILSDLSDILINSEKAYLFLDLLSCPYVKDKKKMSWIKRACTVLEIRTPSDTEARETVQDMGNMHCAVDWKDVDLLNSLEKKELKRAY